jgi:hypothetical protein
LATAAKNEIEIVLGQQARCGFSDTRRGAGDEDDSLAHDGIDGFLFDLPKVTQKLQADAAMNRFSFSCCTEI